MTKTLFILFIFKILDCTLSTLKNIYLIRGNNFISALYNAISTFFYMSMIVVLGKNSANNSIFIICLATFFGSYIPSWFLDRREKDKIFIFDIIPHTSEQGKELADNFRENNLAIMTYKGYDDGKQPILCSQVYSQSKEESTLIENMLPEGCKYHVIEVKKHIINN